MMFFILYILLITPLYVLAHKQPNLSEQEMGPLMRFDAPEKATASIILFHGLGNTWEIFDSFPEMFHSQERFRHINLIIPNAPVRDSPFYHLISGRSPIAQSWFNSSDTSETGFDERQYWEAVEYVHDLVVNETRHGIPPERIIAGGFSQGSLVALGAYASMPVKIGGWLIFCGSAPTNWTSFNNSLTVFNKETPLFHGHGLNDTVINFENAITTVNWFKGMDYNYHLHLYPGMEHQVDWLPNDRDVQEWVTKRIPKKWRKY